MRHLVHSFNDVLAIGVAAGMLSVETMAIPPLERLGDAIHSLLQSQHYFAEKSLASAHRKIMAESDEAGSVCEVSTEGRLTFVIKGEIIIVSSAEQRCPQN